MTRPANPDAELRTVINRRGAVIVAGTGISMAASVDPATGKPHPQASWTGLLENGLDWLRQHNHIEADEAAAHLTLLKKRGDTHHFVSAAQDITRLMGGVDSQHFREWLKRTIGSITAYDRHGLDALEALRRQGNLLATTNYDGLLLDSAGSLQPVTWKESDAFLRAARNEEYDKIIFLHGYWRQPDSVILDWESYQQIAREERYRDELAAVWRMTTWVYVGCGVNGLSDPDFGLLLERYGQRAREADLWDFCLVRNDCRDEFQAHFDKLQVNICAVSFGDSHGQLPGYLRSLLPAVAPASPKVTVMVQPPVEPITEFLRVTDSFFQYRAPHVTAGSIASENRGDFRFTAEEFRSGSVHRAHVVELALDRLHRDSYIWLEGPSAGGKTTVCLHLVSEWNHQGNEPLYLDLAEEPNGEQAAREMTAHAKPGRMFIFDNVHDAPKLACALLDHWKIQCRDSVVVLLGWPAAVHPKHDYLSGHRLAIVPVAVQLEDWIGVYQSTFRQIRGPSHVPPVPPPQTVTGWDDTFGADLVTFQYALAAGLRSASGNAFRILPAAADRYVREKYLDPCSGEERSDLFLLAWFAALGIALPEEAAASRFARSLACGLIRSTSHGRYKDHVRYQPWHRSIGSLLLSLASDADREDALCATTSSYPVCAGIVALRLHQHGEGDLAAKVLECTVDASPSLVDWFGDNLARATAVLQQTQHLLPARWLMIADRLSQPEGLEKLRTQAFATSLAELVTFLRFTGQTAELKSVQTVLIDALVADAGLPADRSQLQAQLLTTQLQFLATFLRYAGQTAELRPVQTVLIDALVADVNLPADQSRLRAQALTTEFGDLVTFMRYTAQTEELEPVRMALVNALVADANLPTDQSRLRAQAFTVPLNFLVSFLQFTGQIEELKPVRMALVNALVADVNLPADRSRLRAHAFTAPLGLLATLLQFTAQTEELKPVQTVLVNALVADVNLPADRSRLRAQVFVALLGDLVAFLQLTGRTIELRPVRAALAEALVADVNLPADRSRLLAQTFTTPLGVLGSFLRFIGDTAEFEPLMNALIDDANLASGQSRLQALAFATPLDHVVGFLQLTGQTAATRPMQAALVRAIVADAKLPAEQSRLLQNARTSRQDALRGFLRGALSIPGLAFVSEVIERDEHCSRMLWPHRDPPRGATVETLMELRPPAPELAPTLASSAPLQFRSPLDDRIEAGIARVLTDAWKSVPGDLTPEDRFGLAMRHAYKIISGLSPHVKRQVGAHFETQRWETLRLHDPQK